MDNHDPSRPGFHMQHWAMVQKAWNGASDFISWMFTTYGIDLDWDHANPGTPLELRRLLNEFFEVDEVALDNERRDMLEAFAAKHEATTEVAP